MSSRYYVMEIKALTFRLERGSKCTSTKFVIQVWPIIVHFSQQYAFAKVLQDQVYFVFEKTIDPVISSIFCIIFHLFWLKYDEISQIIAKVLLQGGENEDHQKLAIYWKFRNLHAIYNDEVVLRLELLFFWNSLYLTLLRHSRFYSNLFGDPLPHLKDKWFMKSHTNCHRFIHAAH